MNKQVPVFVINLQNDVEKKAHMMKLSNSLELNFEFINAVNGENLSDSQIDAVSNPSLSKKELGRELSRGELGCALSHISIFKTIVHQEIDVALILEDDVDISADLLSILNSLEELPDNWELILCGYYADTATEKKSEPSFWGNKNIVHLFQTVRLVEVAYGTHGYLINTQGAKKLLKELTTIIKPIDHYTGSETYVNMYATCPRVITLNPDLKKLSTIEAERIINIAENKIRSKCLLIIQRIWRASKNIKIVSWLIITHKKLATLKKYH